MYNRGDIFHRERNLWERISAWTQGQLMGQQLNTPAAFGLLLLGVLPIAYLLAAYDLKIGVLLLLVLVGVPLVVLSIFYLPLSLSVMLSAAVFIVFGAKYTGAPIGTVLDLLILVSAVGILLRQIRERDWSFLRHPLSTVVAIWLFYNVLQVLNPWAESKMAWLYTVRSVAIQQIVFYVGLYAYRQNRKAILWMLKFMLAIGLFGAIYGLKQHFIGFNAQEMSWVMADPERFQLYYQWGMMRIPSFCYDPTTFGILMACFAVFCGALLVGPLRSWQKILLGLCLVLCLWVMAYTGTRTAFALIPAGAVFYALLTLNRRVLLVGSILAVLGAGFIMKSTSSGVIYRIQSAFKPTKDDSMNLRLSNQKKIQPYIQSHPIGGGLGSCGVWGKRFNPDSELSKFPHDSSFVRMGVELGWIGLILYTLLHYAVVRTGIYYYFRCRDPLIKALYAGITAWCFMLAVACYAQEAILQQPMNVIYNIFLAMLVTLKNFDPAYELNPGTQGFTQKSTDQAHRYSRNGA